MCTLTSNGFYRFPKLSKIPSSNSEQIEKIDEEISESLSALEYMTYENMTYGKGSEDYTSDRIAYGMELMDIIHAVETALRMEFTDGEVERLRNRVEKKNRERGYYD